MTDATLRNLTPEVRTLAGDLRAGRISTQQWAAQMRAIVADAHLLSAASARGGWSPDRMTDEAYGQVGSVIRGQLAYLDGFVADIEGGLPLDGAFTRRAVMYVQRGTNTYERARRAVETGRGMSEVRNLLDLTIPETNHCVGAGSCPAESAKGWTTPDQMSLPGDRICINGCRCRLEWR
ncbi:MAG: hypothetical protein H0V63_05535 [Burkholderiaceae bacterium]|nr:hypothetical protein [Burkholderiaceae bacterium]